MPKLSRLSLLPLAMFLAGFSCLIFEVSWFSMLSLVVGATVAASTIVLVAFMGGFGVGAWFWGARKAKSNNQIRLLAILFSCVAVIGLFSIWMLNYILPSSYGFFSSFSISDGVIRFVVSTFAVVFLFLSPFLMGGVLPLVASLYINSDQKWQRNMGNIYAYETIGSALGGLITGFWLIGFAGQTGTVAIAVMVNVFLAILFFLMKPVGGASSSEITGNAIVVNPKRKGGKAGAHSVVEADYSKAALLVAFIAGFGIIGLQIVWFRIFRIYMTNSGYTFSLIASMVIIGLFVGGKLFAAYGANIRNHIKVLWRVMWFMSGATFLGFVVLVNLPTLVMFPFESISENHAVRIMLIPFLSALLVVVPLTTASGFLFPFACTLYARSFRSIGDSIGKVLLINTAGSVIGPLMAVFLFIPVLGAARSVLVFAAAWLVVASILSHRLLLRNAVVRWLAPSVSLLLFGAALLMPVVMVLPPSFSKFPKKILAYNESTEGTFVVGAEDKMGTRVLSTYVNNSAVIGSTYDAIKVVKMVGHLPFFTGLKCNNVLVVGFGIGVTTSAIASHPEVEQIDCVELVAGLKGAAHYYSELNHGIEHDPRLMVHSGDGRHFLHSSSRKFDLISTDPTHPILGSASLYTREYFELCRNHLNQGGMVSQYLPLHKLLPADFKGILATFKSVFPDCTIWLGHYHAVLLGFTRPTKIDFRQWSASMAAMQPDIWFYNNPYALASCLVLDGDEVARYTAGMRILTDNFPYTEYCSLRSFDAGNLPLNLASMNNQREAVSRVFYNIPDPALMQHYVEGNRLMTEALRLMLVGDRQGFMMKMQEATVMNPDNQEFPFMMKLNLN